MTNTDNIREELQLGHVEEVAKLGIEVLPELVSLFTNPKSQVQEEAARAIAYVAAVNNNNAEIVSKLPEIANALSKGNFDARYWGVWTIGCIACANEGNAEVTKVIPAVVSMADDEGLQQIVMNALNKMNITGDLEQLGRVLAECISSVREQGGSLEEVSKVIRGAAWVYSQNAMVASEEAKKSAEMAGELADVRPMRPRGWNETFRQATMRGEMARTATVRTTMERRMASA